jgi:hypothetical protein
LSFNLPNANSALSKRAFIFTEIHTRCTNTIFDAAQLAFLKGTADRIRSYLDDGRIGTTQRLLLLDQLDELTTVIADHESRPAPGHQRD